MSTHISEELKELRAEKATIEKKIAHLEAFETLGEPKVIKKRRGRRPKVNGLPIESAFAHEPDSQAV